MKKKIPTRPPKTRAAAPVRRAVIPANCRSLDAAYDILARDLGFPARFGRNLDALWDCLTADVPGPYAIVVENAAALKRALGVKGPALLALLKDVRRARSDARITLRGAG
jgi:ribonuclease inhibitor